MAFLRRFISMLTGRQKLGLAGAFCLAVVSAVVELFGIGLVVLLLQSFATSQSTGLLAKLTPFLGLFDFNNPYNPQLNLILFLFGIYLFRLTMLLLYSSIRVRLMVSVQHHVMRRVFRGMMALPYSAYGLVDPPSVLATLLHVAPRLGRNFLNGVLTVGVEATLMVTIVVALMIQEPLTTALVGGVLFMVYAGVQSLTQTQLRANGREETRISKAYQQIVLDSFRGFREIRIHGMTRAFERQHDRILDEEAGVLRRQRRLTEVPRHFIETGIILTVLSLVLVQLLLKVPIAEFASRMLVLAVAIARLMPCANRLAVGWSEATHSQSCIDDIQELYARFPEQSHREGDDHPPLHLHEALRLEDVDFAYPESPLTLRGISMTIPRGAMVGIIGGSGSGKTTLLEIIAGLLPPTGGRVSLDGKPLAAEQIPGWLKRVGYIPQSTVLFSGSIEENIVFGRDYDQEALDEAVKAAALGPLLARFPEGLKAQVGEGGDRLSGGERQRIGIARALYLRPDILILDEATSALDVNTEATILASLEKLRERVTTITVAHRLSAVAPCDIVHWLDAGRIRASGPYEAVVAAFTDASTLGREAKIDVDKIDAQKLREVALSQK